MGENAQGPWIHQAVIGRVDNNMDTHVPLTVGEARREYFHFLAVPFQKYIGYREWKLQQNIEVITTPYVQKLIKATGYTGRTEIDDLYYWIDGELDLIDDRIDSVRNILAGVINFNMDLTIAGLADVYFVLNNAINTISGMMQAVDRRIADLVIKTAGWISDTLDMWSASLETTIGEVSEWIVSMGLTIKAGIVEALTGVGNRLDLMYQQVAEAIEALSGGSSSNFEVIGDIIIAAVKGAVDLAVTIVEALAGVITATVESLERVLTNLIEGIIKTVDILVTGIKETVGATITTLIDYLKWLWEEITGLLDKMFDFNIENLTPLFVALFEAQKNAFAILKERAETVQP